MTDLDHERVLTVTGRRSGLPIFVAVHSTALGQAVGGCRLWRYPHWAEALDDALRLSRAMTLKCAVSGLSLGGGKSVIAIPPEMELTQDHRRAVLLDLGDTIESLGGAYGVGEDVGTTAQDMATIRERTAHVYGLPESDGGFGEPSAPTAVGVYEAIRVTCEHLYGSSQLAGRTFTIIGLGQVGSRLAERLTADGAKLIVTDVDTTKRTLSDRVGADWIDVGDALSVESDILVPAALGELLTADTVSRLQCAAIVGPANNQLADDEVANLLANRGVLWAPDFLVNAGGVIYGAHMEFGARDPDTAMAAVHNIGRTLEDVYARAAQLEVTPLEASLSVAHERVTNARSGLEMHA